MEMYFRRMFSFAKKKKVIVYVFKNAQRTSVCKILVRILNVMTNNTFVKGACKDVILLLLLFFLYKFCAVLSSNVSLSAFLSRERSAVTFA